MLLNGLHDLEQTSIPVAHPSNDIGTLLEIRLEDDDTATVTFDVNLEEFREVCDGIRLEYGDTPYRDLPSTTTLVKALTASGVIEFANHSRIESTVESVCYPAVDAGESPVMLGLDANVFPWGFPKMLDIDHQTGTADGSYRRPSNGYALSSGVVDEIHWKFSYSNTDPLEEPFGAEFRRLEGQPDGS